MKLYVFEKRPKNLNSLLISFLAHTYRGGYFVARPTYFDKECTKIHCLSNRMRSFDDILAVAQTYFPKVTPKSLMHRLLTLNIFRENRYYKCQLAYCGTMRKIRFLPYRDLSINNINARGESTNTWKELLAMLNLKPNPHDINRYIEKHRKNEQPV